jgi:hypothetical protein
MNAEANSKMAALLSSRFGNITLDFTTTLSQNKLSTSPSEENQYFQIITFFFSDRVVVKLDYFMTLKQLGWVNCEDIVL